MSGGIEFELDLRDVSPELVAMLTGGSQVGPPRFDVSITRRRMGPGSTNGTQRYLRRLKAKPAWYWRIIESKRAVLLYERIDVYGVTLEPDV